jgi:periplasmic divalent cation tolerance protein
MGESNDVLLVFVTAGSQDEAQNIARAAVESRVAACATMLPVRSVYRWEGKLVDDQESLILLKTTSEHYGRLQDVIRGLHSYKVPEILAVPVEKGFEQYIEWVRKETTGYS